MEQLKTTVINYENGIYAIDQQMVRAFLIVGTKKALLLDTGAVRIDILSYIKEITSLPIEVILTHSDVDHTANLQDFERAYINEADIPTLLSNESFKNVKFNRLSDGDVFDIGGRTLKVLFTPGHTLGSVCLIDEENKILFAGDTVSYGPVFMFGENRSIKDYVISLKRLDEMRESGLFTSVYCCHNQCPISADTLNDLTACASGVFNKTIEVFPCDMPYGERKPLICKTGKCSILVDGDYKKV